MIKNLVKSKQRQSNHIIGHFDYIHEGYAYGWACDRTNPLKRLKIDIVSNGIVVGHGLADQYREDLFNTGIGDGKYLFRLRISYELYNGEPHSLVAQSADNSSLLDGGPHIFGPETDAKDFDLIPRNSGIEILQEILHKPEYSAQAENKENLEKAYLIGARLQETYHLADARYVWESIIKSMGDNALCRCKIAETHLLTNEVEMALDEYRKSVQSDLLLYWAHLGLSNAQRILGKKDDAEASLEFACGLAPQNNKLAKRLLKLKIARLPERIDKLLQNSKYDEAIDLLTDSLVTAPEDAYIREKLSTILSKNKEYDCSERTAYILKAYDNSKNLLELIMRKAAALQLPIQNKP